MRSTPAIPATMVFASFALCSLLACSESAPAPAGASAPSTTAAPPRGPRISGILVTLDTTNATALGCYIPQHAYVTPNLLAFAQQSVVYLFARSVTPLTLPAHSSMMTGLYPLRHTVRVNGVSPLPSSATTLAELAKEEQYDTAAFVSAVVLAAPFQLSQGFDTYEQPHGKGGIFTIVERNASETTQAAQAWLKHHDRSRPFFLWVHYYDAHAPYRPPPEFLQKVRENEKLPPPKDDRDKQALEQRLTYLGEVAYVDQQFGELMKTVSETQDMDRIMIVGAGDHGESLNRRDEPTHSVFCYDDTLRVPLIVHLPGRQRAGERSQEIVSLVDVMPTLAEGMGLPAAAKGLDGTSLV